ncbi:hypothetical protein EGYY_02610 [Eggerthella sp. YY7918]|nr:hypothetical protein EGYY_02610 [Eggerthella sp. YY7918]
MLPANPVTACTVYAKKNATEKRTFSIYATILTYANSASVALMREQTEYQQHVRHVRVVQWLTGWSIWEE